jgi:uncharacterized protein YjiS (DUF1127 family)
MARVYPPSVFRALAPTRYKSLILQTSFWWLRVESTGMAVAISTSNSSFRKTFKRKQTMKTLAISYYFSDFDPVQFWAREPSQSLWRRAAGTVSIWIDRSRQRRHLLELPDHLLRDIGVTRVEVEAETAKPFWRA